MFTARDGSEISDKIIAFDPATLQRQPVSKTSVVEHFLAAGDERAARIVEVMPVLDGNLVRHLWIACSYRSTARSSESRRSFNLQQPFLMPE
jgi:hypothetical protein